MIEVGKAIKSFVKNVIDKLPVIQVRGRDENFYKLYQELSQHALHAESEEMKNIQDKAKIIEMLQNEEQRSAIKELVKARVIQSFSEENMKRLTDTKVLVLMKLIKMHLMNSWTNLNL
ncbi:hypothetical protein [Wolbachia pipientis]|uniref:hypothetical protein n=1 Tax=Wolbachia pipientis TaxID=955 RepID=UPI0025A3C878|nr:hypothetical protein [Wolbachia pipientis]MDM8335170.1 hypothetical protein [Wolbachia pipientis]